MATNGKTAYDVAVLIMTHLDQNFLARGDSLKAVEINASAIHLGQLWVDSKGYRQAREICVEWRVIIHNGGVLLVRTGLELSLLRNDCVIQHESLQGELFSVDKNAMF